jgi:hypothetical protein
MEAPMGITTRVRTAIEELLGVTIDSPARRGLVTFGGAAVNSFMINFLGALASNVAGRGMDMIGTPYPLGVAIGFSIPNGGAGGEGYEGDCRYRLPLNYTNKARTAVSAVLALAQVDAALAITPGVWCRFGYTTDGFATATYITAIAQLSTAVTTYEITTAAIPEGALLFAEVSIGVGEFVAGVASVALR